jgi:hypothetical protein
LTDPDEPRPDEPRQEAVKGARAGVKAVSRSQMPGRWRCSLAGMAWRRDVPGEVGFAATAAAAFVVAGLAADARTVGLVLLAGMAVAAGALVRLRAALPAMVLAWLFGQSLLYSPTGYLRLTHPGELAVLAGACLAGAALTRLGKAAPPPATPVPHQWRKGQDQAHDQAH